MKRIIACIAVVLWTVSVMADKVAVAQNFQTMAVAGDIVFTPNNHVGATDFVTYTCSGSTGSGYAHEFTSYNGNISIYLKGTNSQVVTSKIADLDSLNILYLPADSRTMTVEASTDNVNWKRLDVKNDVNGKKTVKMLVRGDYYIRIKRNSDIYITQITYILEDCHALEVTRSEE